MLEKSKRLISLLFALAIFSSVSLSVFAAAIEPRVSNDAPFDFRFSSEYGSDSTGIRQKENTTSSYVNFTGGAASTVGFEIWNGGNRNCTEAGTVYLSRGQRAFIRQDVYEYAAANNYQWPYWANLVGRGTATYTAWGQWSPDSVFESGVPEY